MEPLHRGATCPNLINEQVGLSVKDETLLGPIPRPWPGLIDSW